MKRKVTVEMEKTINDMYSSGHTYKEISAVLGIACTTVRQYVVDKRKVKITMDMMEEINKLYKSGLSFSDIAEMFKVCASTASNYTWQHRKSGRPKGEVDDWIKNNKEE